MEDPKYPIWRCTIKFDETAYQNNSLSFSFSFKEMKTDKELELFVFDQWNKIAARTKNKDKGFVYKGFQLEFLGEETWYLEWFCHTSLTRFNNEADAFNSLKKFLIRKGVSLNNGDFGTEFTSDECDYMSMGADDLFRWKYCKCDNCIEESITIISH